ncbi:MAG: Zn-dependent hydrolase [Gammaproteobacteria bacterium]
MTAPEPDGAARSGDGPGPVDGYSVDARLAAFAPVELTADLSHLSLNQVRMIELFIEAADIMDRLFWLQAYGEPEPLLASLGDTATRRFAEINYGPWDRLAADRPFVDGAGPKPPGAQFYPEDMSRAEFEAADFPGKADLYTLVRRGEDGTLYAEPYHVAYQQELGRAARLLAQAAELAENDALRRYLELRARALITDDYRPSDLAWMDMKDNELDLVIGAIETYEDQLFGYRAAYEAYVLVKDTAWSERLARFAAFLPDLQAGLPVSEFFKSETPGTDSDLNAYDVIYYAGHCNAGSKTIAINLPNDEQVQLAKGTRRLQLKNAMRAKFDKIMVPIAGQLVAPDQRDHVTFDAFFGNTMFHEVAHGLGIKNTVNDRGTVREALKEYASSMEEGKADVLGLYMITWLHDRGELPDAGLMDYYVTFMTGIFRSVRFGATSAHGRANMVRFNFFRNWGAFSRDPATGLYRVDEAKMRAAIDALSAQILTLQGSGDYAGAEEFTERMGVVGPVLESDLERLEAAGIPVDVTFRQGMDVLGLRTSR